MECRNCPYAKDEFDRRMNWYQEYSEKNGIPNDIYGYLTYDDAAEFEEEFCWCEKTGGKVYWYGQCSDAYSNEIKHKKRSNRKKRSKRERDLKHKNHLKYLAENTSGHPSPAYPVDKNGNYYISDPEWLIWFPDDAEQEFAYYKRRYRSSGKRSSSNYHKKMSNRKIRRYKGEISNGWNCHKLYDYWWEMY